MFGHVEGAEINFSYVHHALIDLANFFALLFGAGKILYSVFIELFQWKQPKQWAETCLKCSRELRGLQTRWKFSKESFKGERGARSCHFLQTDLNDLSIHPPFPSYSPSTSLFTEQINPDTLQTTPRLRIHTSISRSLTARRPHCSLRWNRHGSMSVMAAPVTLPVKPINRENLGTSRARRYDVISRAPRTNRAGLDTPLCLE